MITRMTIAFNSLPGLSFQRQALAWAGRSMLVPAFGELPVESITTAHIEHWLGGLPQSPRTRTLALVLMHGIFRRAKKVWGPPVKSRRRGRETTAEPQRRHPGPLTRGRVGAGARRRRRAGRRDPPHRSVHGRCVRRVSGPREVAPDVMVEPEFRCQTCGTCCDG
jgi:hypothetical protein